jgi:transcriptional antiterminator RfaH
MSRVVPETWYLAQLKPGGLDRAVANLARQGYESLMPLREETRRRAGRWSTIVRPLFPGYIFIKVADDKRNWRAINATYGVSRLVALEAGCPTQVDPSIISALQVRVGDAGIVKSPSGLKVGDQVEVVSGPLANKFAEIESIPEHGRIYVLLELMGRHARIELPAADVEHRSAVVEMHLA